MDKDNDAFMVSMRVNIGKIMPLPLIYKEKISGPDIINVVVDMEFFISGYKIKQLIATGCVDIHRQPDTLQMGNGKGLGGDGCFESISIGCVDLHV